MWFLWVILLAILAVIGYFLVFWIRYIEIPSTMVFQRKGFLTREILYLAGFYSLYEDKKYKSNNVLKLYEKPNQVAIITGAKRGIGYELTKILMKCGMTVVMGVRDVEGTKKIAEALVKEIPTGKVDVEELDVSSLKSIDKFAKVIKEKYPKVHLLVNNAGILFPPYKITEDGFELSFGTNYLGHFYLTHLLLPCIRRASENLPNSARVVNVTSIAHFGSKIEFEDVHQKKVYAESIGYAQSKLAQVMFTRSLDRLFERECMNARSYSVHPGMVATDMPKGAAPEYLKNHIDNTYKSPYEGAVSVAYCCLSPDIENKGGMYSSNCMEGWSSQYSKDHFLQEKLFLLSAFYVDIDPYKFGEEPEVDE